MGIANIVVNFRSASGASTHSIWMTKKQAFGWLILDSLITLGIGILIGRAF